MSEEQLKAFLEKVKGDTSLQEKLKAAGDADAVLAIAKEAGFMISVGDFKMTQSKTEDDELESAAGGKSSCDYGSKSIHIHCFLSMAGYGPIVCYEPRRR